MKICQRCGRNFRPRRSHFYLCFECWCFDRHDRQTQPVTVQRSIPQPWLTRLIMLSHPDRHGGSKLAVEATQWLLAQRQESRVDG